MSAREGGTVCAAVLGFLPEIAPHAFSVYCLTRLFRLGGGKLETVLQAVVDVAAGVVG